MMQEDGSQPPQEVNVGNKVSLQCIDNEEVLPHFEKVLQTASVQIKGCACCSSDSNGCKGT